MMPPFMRFKKRKSLAYYIKKRLKSQFLQGIEKNRQIGECSRNLLKIYVNCDIIKTSIFAKRNFINTSHFGRLGYAAKEDTL